MTSCNNPVAPLGSQGLKVARLGFGCMSLSKTFYGDPGLTTEEAMQVVRSAYEQGVRLFNTSDLYGPYDNEILVGQALEGKPDAVIATKWGPMIVPGKGIVADFSPEYCRKACQGSLERLRVPAIDLFTLRGPVGPDVDLEATMRTVKALVEEGKVKYVGMSEVSADEIRRAHAIVPITAIELEWSLFTRDVESDIVPLCRELGIGIIAYSPLGRGMLTGAIKSMDQLQDGDWRKHAQPRFAALDKNLELVAEVERVAAAKGCTPGQVALAWLMAQGDDVFPIPGTKREKYLVENMGALTIKLTTEELTTLGQLADKVVGTRYADMKHTYHGSGKAH